MHRSYHSPNRLGRAVDDSVAQTSGGNRVSCVCGGGGGGVHCWGVQAPFVIAYWISWVLVHERQCRCGGGC